MSTDNPTADRDFLDPVFKEVMTFNFGQLALPVETQVEVSRLPRTMDALVVLEQDAEREKVHEQTAIYYASRVEPETTKEVLQMAGKQSLYEKQLQRIVDSMGTDLLEKMTPEERMQGLTVSERVQGLTVSERLAGLPLEDLQTLDPKMKAALLQLLNQSDSTQE